MDSLISGFNFSKFVTFIFQASSLKEKLKEIESQSHQLQKNINYYKSQFNQSVTQVIKKYYFCSFLVSVYYW